MATGHGSRSPRHLLALFLGTTFVLLASLGWLGWWSFRQDRAVEVQRVRERLESATDVIAAEIRQNLTDIEEELTRLSLVPPANIDEAISKYATQLGDDALTVVFEANRVRAYPPRRLLYYPTLEVPADPPNARFAAGEALEFKDRDFKSAIAYFQELAQDDDEAVRAAALLRLARNQRKVGQSEAALSTYTELAGIDGAYVGGWPAELRARKTRCDVLEQLGRRAELHIEAEKLDRDLHAGR